MMLSYGLYPEGYRPYKGWTNYCQLETGVPQGLY